MTDNVLLNIIPIKNLPSVVGMAVRGYYRYFACKVVRFGRRLRGLGGSQW